MSLFVILLNGALITNRRNQFWLIELQTPDNLHRVASEGRWKFDKIYRVTGILLVMKITSGYSRAEPLSKSEDTPLRY